MRFLLAGLFLAGLVAAAIWFYPGGAQPPAAVAGEPDEPEPPPPPPPAKKFVGSETCKECHADRHETWLETGHAYSLREAIPATVAGQFDGTPIKSRHFEATPFIRDGAYYIKVIGKDGRPSGEHKITAVVGRLIEQAYLFTGPSGEWRVLPLCWSLEEGKWHETHKVLDDIAGHERAAGDEHYDTRERVFNHGCGQCHATDYDVGHVLRDDGKTEYRSTFLEGAVACETCHGPGGRHVRWHEKNSDASDTTPDDVPLLRPHKDLDAQGVLESCGRCHYQHGIEWAIPDDPRAFRFDIAQSRNYDRPGFAADGRLTGLNYHGSTQSQSPCFQKGEMSCLSCHKMHGGKKWAMKWEEKSDQQCTQCHEQETYEADTHTFHDVHQARCVDCHMPRFMTGVLHFMRDHRIRSPQPELTEKYGKSQSPNACNTCHADQTPQWAREHKERWWGEAPRRLVEDVGQIVALRRRPERVPVSALAATMKRKDSETFFRLTAVRELIRRGADDEAKRALRDALESDHVEVVQLAVRGLGSRLDPKAAPALRKLVDHRLRTIRVGAAYALARMGWREQSESTERVWADAEAAFVRQLIRPWSTMRSALLADAFDKGDAVETYTRRAVTLAPPTSASRLMLQVLQQRARRMTEADRHQDAVVQYRAVLGLTGEKFGADLLVDSADSLADAGRSAEAVANWRRVLRRPDVRPALVTIATARLAARTGAAQRARAIVELEKLAAVLEKSVIGGQDLRRVRFALRAIERDGGG
ncbi:MAG: multiheme c-type cytochrome [Planctomycetota bacterium]|nr:multiheme c-type cytochrome [Planctomycetota bacterium]